MSRIRAWSKGKKIGYGILLVYVLGIVGFAVGFGLKGHKNESFKVIDAFHLETWFHIAGPLNFDKGVLYLLIAASLTLGIMLYVARHMQQRPGRMQVAVEMGYELMSQVTRREHGREDDQAKWFPLIFTLFVFILVSNLIGYIPLPVDSREHVQALRRPHPVASRSTPPSRTSRSRWSWRSACSSRTTPKGSEPMAPSGI